MPKSEGQASEKDIENIYLVAIHDRYHMISVHHDNDDAIRGMARYRSNIHSPCVLRYGATGVRLSQREVMDLHFHNYALAAGEDPEKIWRRLAA